MGSPNHLYSIPPLVRALFLYSLGIVALFSRKDVPPVHCYPAQLNHVFRNILTNANKAIQDDGEIKMESEVGVGSTFTVVLPTRRPRRAASGK